MTLIELLIVVAILGILAAVVLPTISNARENSQINSAAASFRNLSTSYQRYHSDHQAWPGNPSQTAIISPDLEGYFPQAGEQVESTIGGYWVSHALPSERTTQGGSNYTHAPVQRLGDAEKYDDLDAVVDDGDTATGSVQLQDSYGGQLVWLVQGQ